MKTRISTLALAVASASLFSSTAMASGFKLNEQSASGVGTAYAGRAAVVEDASTVYYNPAGMSKLTRPEISVGGAYINIDAEFSNGERINPAGTSSKYETGVYDHGGSLIPASSIPFVYYAHPINEKLALGFGVFVPFGAHTDYSDNALSGGFAGKTELTTIDFQPAFSYKINDTLAIGGGLDIVYAKGTLSKQLDLVPYVPAGHPLDSVLNKDEYKGYENTFSVEGDDVAFGWNLGLMWDITPATTLGVTYRSEVEFTLEGDAEFKKKDGEKVFNEQLAASPFAQNGLVFADLAADAASGVSMSEIGANFAQGQYTGKVEDQAAKVPLTGPQNATISLAHRFTDKFQLQGGITWTDWSSFKYFDVIGKESGDISDLTGLGQNYIGHIVEKWSDSYAYAIGGTYTLNDQWLFRAGFAYDEAPVNKNHRTARVPDNDRKWLTAGARYTVNQDMSFDLGLAYLIMSDFSMSEFNYDLKDKKMQPEKISGDYSMDAFGISAQMNYRF